MLVIINWTYDVHNVHFCSLQDVEEAIVTLIRGTAWDEALRLVSGVISSLPSLGGCFFCLFVLYPSII